MILAPAAAAEARLMELRKMEMSLGEERLADCYASLGEGDGKMLSKS